MTNVEQHSREAQAANRKTDLRLPQLDALRGLAALTVFFAHAIPMMPVQPDFMAVIEKTPLRLCYDGLTAVLLFFVLSGFVLNLKFASLPVYERNWVAQFLVRRVFRIYPAFLAAVGICLLLKHTAFDPAAASPFSDWFAKYWRTPVSWSETMRVLTLIGNGLNIEDNPVIWSLTYEMRISLLFPIIILVVNRGSARSNLFALGIVYVCSFLLCSNGTVRYFPHFVLGAVCARHFGKISTWLKSRPLSVKLIWGGSAWLLYEAKTWLPFDHPTLQTKFLLEQAAAIGAAGFILACASFPTLGKLLQQRIFRFIGVTSYSFYLLHFIMLVALSPLVYARVPSFGVTWAIALVVSYAVALLVYRWIEIPFMTLGGRVARAFHGWRATPAPIQLAEKLSAK